MGYSSIVGAVVERACCARCPALFVSGHRARPPLGVLSKVQTCTLNSAGDRHAELDEMWLDVVARDGDERRAGKARPLGRAAGLVSSSARRSSQDEHRGDGAPRSADDPAGVDGSEHGAMRAPRVEGERGGATNSRPSFTNELTYTDRRA